MQCDYRYPATEIGGIRFSPHAVKGREERDRLSENHNDGVDGAVEEIYVNPAADNPPEDQSDPLIGSY